jgi:hypothetical protein
MIGFNSEAEARKTYRAGFSDGKDRIKHMRRMSMADFRAWLEKGDTRKQIKHYAMGGAVGRAIQASKGYADGGSPFDVPAEALLARSPLDNAAPVSPERMPALPVPLFQTKTGVTITDHDIENAMNVGMATSGGGLSTKGSLPVGPTGIRAYHGSPHDFDRFDLSKIGTGEGAQAYGHGMYFAEREGVAKSYRDALAGSTVDGRPFNPANPLHQAAARIEEHGNRAAAIAETEKRIAADPGDDMHSRVLSMLLHRTEIPPINSATGKMYEVNINANPEHFLDWDKPLKDQPHIMDAASKLGPDVARRLAREKYSPGRQLGDIIANEHLPLGQATDANISAAMREAGIPGVKYLDQGPVRREMGPETMSCLTTI